MSSPKVSDLVTDFIETSLSSITISEKDDKDKDEKNEIFPMVVSAKLEDLDNIMAINESSLAENYCRNTWEYILDAGIINIAFVRDKIVGYIAVLEMGEEEKESPNYQNLLKVCKDDCIEVISVAVLEEYRNKLIGHELINSVLNTISKKYSVALQVRKSNTHAQHAYEKHGFKVCDVLKDYYSHDVEDALLMYK